MRFNDFKPILTEASWWTYPAGTYFNVGSSTKGKTLETAIKKVIPDFDTAERLIKVEPDDSNAVSVNFGKDSGNYLFVKRDNGQILKIIGGQTTVGSALNHAGSEADSASGKKEVKSKVNLGDISEGVLGAALYAKLLARTGSGIGKITNQDVWDVINSKSAEVADNGVTWQETSADIGGAIDKISYRMRIKGQAARALVDKANFKKIDSTIVGSSVSFVNGRYGTKYAEAIYLNRKADEIGIVSDGLSEQKADPVTGLVKKTDVFITSTDADGQKVKERLPISLKAGSSTKQFGQVSGKTFEKMTGLFAPFNLDVSSLQEKWNNAVKGSNKASDSIKGAKAIFPDIAKMLNDKLKGPEAEAGFVHNIAAAIHYYASSNDPKVRLVQLIGANKVNVLNTNLLFARIKEDGIDLYADTSMGENNAKIIIKDRKSGKPLLTLRSYWPVSSDVQRNIIEMEKLMKELCSTDWEGEAGNLGPEKVQVRSQPISTAPAAPARAPASLGQPSGMTAAPTSTLAQPQDQDYSQDDELARVRKNAGIQVE
jgi:hypothetical protein